MQKHFGSFRYMIAISLLVISVGSLLVAKGEPDEVCDFNLNLCNDVFWSSLDSYRGSVPDALTSWIRSCRDGVPCKQAAGNGSFLLRCAQKMILDESQALTASALKLMRHAARVSAHGAWKRSRHYEEEVQCKRPREPRVRRQFDAELLETPLEQGRRCEEGHCNGKCILLVLDEVISMQDTQDLVSHAESVKLQHAQPSPTKNKVDIDLHLSARYGQGDGHILFLYVLEILRHLLALTAEVPLSWVGFASHFLSHLAPDNETGLSKGTIHCDESSFERFHYSAVVWLTEQNQGTGGELQFWDPALRDWRITLKPQAGRVALFTSGWENIHRVTPLRVGQRWSLPFFASVQAPFDSTRLSKACLRPKSSKQWQYCEARLQQWLSAPDDDIL